MKNTITTCLVVGSLSMLMATAVIAQGKAPQDRINAVDRDRDYDRDRDRDRDRLEDPTRDRDRIQDRTHVPDSSKLKDNEIYGNGLMTKQERNQYRKEIHAASSTEERDRLRMQHQKEMQKRAKTQNKTLKNTSEGPIYGGSMLSTEERNQYRERLRLMDSEKEKNKFLAQHKERMRERAKEKGIPVNTLK